MSGKESTTSFRFGDGNLVTCEKTVAYHAKIGKKNIMIKTDVINTDLPLLLSKSSMQKANVKIDFSNDTVSMLDQKVNIVLTSSGDYDVPISKTNQIVEDFDRNNGVGQVYLTVSQLSKKSNDQKLKIANKLHCHFGHASPKKMKKLIKASNMNDEELLDVIDLVDQKCQVCLQYKKLKLRSDVSFSLSKDFNDVVVANLKSINGILISNMTDHATRFSAASLVKSKKREEIDAFIKYWIAIFGAPGTILSDNGGEFSNNLFHVLGEQFNINVKK